MKMESQKFPDLNDLAFTGRNRDYGSYYLRKKYRKFLTLSFIIATIIFLGMFLVPLILYYSDSLETKFSQEELYIVEYNFIQSPENDLPALPMMSTSEEEIQHPPVVVDSVPEKKERKEEIKPEEEKKDEKKPDSSATEGKGNSPQGTSTGEDNGIYTTIDVFPKFPGGDVSRLTFLRNNIRYPEGARNTGIQGVVMVVFVIETDGSITHVQVTKGIGAGCDDEAMRVIKLMPRWDPGRRAGRAVRVMVKMPIVFSIPGKK